MKRSLAERIYTLVLWLHPPAFRRECGGEILQLVRTSAGRLPAGQVLALAARDGVVSLAREWRGALLPSSPSLQPASRDIMRNLLRDFALAVRLLAKSPTFTIAAVLTLALGIGANTAMFTLADATLLRPVPVRAPDELVVWSWTSSYPHYREYAKRTDIFQGVLASGGSSRANLVIDGSAELVQTAAYSGNAFDVMGVGVESGRPLLPTDDEPGAPIVCVLNYGFWQRRFGADPSAVGRHVQINGKPMTIVGVAQRGFRGVTLESLPSIYITTAASSQMRTGFMARVDPMSASGFVWLNVIGRLRPDVSLAQATDAMDALYSQIQPPGPGGRDEKLRLEPFETRALGRGADKVRTFVVLLLGIVGLTLLIGCANLANLLLARAAARRREMGVRLALGATRARILQQVLTESVLLALLGGAAGIGVASLTIQALTAFELPGGLDLANVPLRISNEALAVTFGLSLLTGLLFGAAPAWRASRQDVLASLREGSRTSTTRGALRSTLLVAQVAMSLVLLAGTGLFARSLKAALDIPLGFTPQNVVVASVNLGLAGYSVPQAESFYRQALERTELLPQVQAAAWGNLVPTRGLFMGQAAIERQEAAEESVTIYGMHVGSDYFTAIGTRLVAGRPFERTDRDGTPLVAIINRMMAQKYWPGRDPIGGRIKMFNRSITIVGVVENSVVRELREEPVPQVFLAFDQWLEGPMGVATDPAHLFVRTSGDPADIIPVIREQLRAIDPQLPLYTVVPLEDRVASLTMPQRLGATLFSFFSAIALALALVGIYGVATYVAASRTREIGVRLALGASIGTIRRLVLMQGAIPIAIGIALGAALAIYAARAARAFLVDVTPSDPVTFVIVPLLLATLALAASYLPARRAARIDPVNALREE